MFDFWTENIYINSVIESLEIYYLSNLSGKKTVVAAMNHILMVLPIFPHHTSILSSLLNCHNYRLTFQIQQRSDFHLAFFVSLTTQKMVTPKHNHFYFIFVPYRREFPLPLALSIYLKQMQG